MGHSWMKTFLFSAFSMLLGGALFAAVADPWISSGYQRRIFLTNFSPVDPSSPLNDFPVLVAITNASWFDAMKSDGGDITFAGVDGKQLFHDIEYFGIDGSGLATLQAWVCVPTLTNKTGFWMYWRNPGTSMAFDGSNTTRALSTSLSTLNAAAIRSNTWDSNFLVVMHFAETAGMPKDATRFQCDATSVGTNLYSNRSGIGVGMGNSMQTFNNSGWGGYYSLNQLYTTQNGPGWGGATGVRIGAFNNSFGVNAAADRIYTNNLGNGCVTHSMWVRYDDYPSNWQKGVFIAGANLRLTNYSPATNGNTSSSFWGLNRGWGDPESDGYGEFRIYATNGYPAWNYRQVGGSQSALRVTNTNFGPVGYYQNWVKYDQAVQYNFGLNQAAVRVIQNGATIFSNYYTTSSAETSTKFNGLTLMGTSYEYLPATYVHQKASPKANFDEYRLSAISRNSNWCATEYSNVVSSTNMAFGNGAGDTNIHCYSYLGFTNVNPFMAQGFPFRGFISPLGLPTARLIIQDVNATVVYDQPVSANGTAGWVATPIIPVGNYTAYLSCTNADGVFTATTNVSFKMVIASALTIQSLTPSGVPLVGQRLLGPGIADSGVRTNNARGEATFSNLLSSVTYSMTNFAPVPYGLPFVTTNITMPTSDTLVVWLVSVPENLGLSTNSNASSRADAPAYFPALAPYLSLSVPPANNATLRVLVTATPISGGRKVQLFEGTVGPAFPYIQVASSDLKLKLTSGTWLLEFQYLRPGLDRSKNETTRRMLFFAQ